MKNKQPMFQGILAIKKRLKRKDLAEMIEDNEDVTRVDVNGIEDMSYLFLKTRVLTKI